MLCRKTVICIVSLVLSLSAFSQQKQWPKTFLWRISGNGLTKPSFLYGTMHLSDKKLFYFTDSLYYYLGQAEGFNIELDADSLVAVSVRKYTEKDNGRKLKEIMKRVDYEKYSQKLSKTLHKPADKITTQDVWMAKNRKTAEAYKKGDMSSFMDLYLYGIARRQGKKVGGIEDIEDQMDAIDEVFDELDVEVLVSDTTKRVTESIVERMKSIYLRQDLDQIDEVFNGPASSEFANLQLRKRNLKMSGRMDSLSHERSCFFAIGVAHLPGDSGVITLLRNKGFRVDPVFSTKKVAPGDYSFKEVIVPWTTFTHDLKLYTVEMPGAPQPMDMYKQVMDMRYYYDIAESKAYFTAVINSSVDSTKKDSVFTAMIKRMSLQGVMASKKIITKQDYEGRDVTINSSDGNKLRMNVFMAGGLVYMSMVSAKELEKLADKSSRRFFESFSMTPHSSFSRAYINYSDTTSAFSVSLPDQPALSTEAETDEAGDVKTFSAHDYSSGNFFFVSVRNTKKGTYIPDYADFLDLMKASLAASMQEDTTSYHTVYEGYPALVLNGTAKNENAFYRTLIVLRGSRAYTLMAVVKKSDQKSALADSFFRSFKLLKYSAVEWKLYNAPDHSFSAWLPADFEAEKETEMIDTTDEISATDSAVNAAGKARTEFLSYDKTTATSYNIVRSGFENYYWAANDTALFQNEIQQFIAKDDTISSVKFSKTGKDLSADYEITHPESSIVKKLRLILHGDTLYKVYAYSPFWLLDDKNSQKFFSSFSILSPAAPSALFTNKTTLLVNDLSSADSAAFEKASSYLYSADLPKASLRAFHPLLITPLKDFEESSYNTNVKLAGKVAEIADSSTVDFILQQYPLLIDQSKKLQYPLLKMLVEMKQTYASEAIKKLLALPSPPDGNASVFVSSLYDSLPYAKSLFPQFISFTSDTTAALKYAYLLKHLIDSSLVTKEEVLPYLNNFIASADQQRKKIKKNDDEFDYNLSSIIDLFGTINNAESNAQLQVYSKVNNLDTKYVAAEWLIKNKQPVSAEVILKLASSNQYRTNLYDALKTAGKASLFPAVFLSQKMFAASYVYNYAVDDESYPEGVQFLMEKTADYKGRKQKFCLFKVSFNDGEEVSYSLGIAGPFSLDLKKVTSENEATGFYWKESFSAKKINEQFAEYLKLRDSDE